MGSKTTVSKTSLKKDGKKIPAGATIIDNRVEITVREIQNGFIVQKSNNVEYRPKGSEHTDYMYITKEWYSKEDPLTITSSDKSLADAFDEIG